jgi:hypothetical protein
LIYCGIDWAERTYDVALVDDSGQLLTKRHITDDAAGYKILLDLLVEFGDSEENPTPVAIETSRGLLVAVLRTGKRQVFAINLMAAARYRDRHSVQLEAACTAANDLAEAVEEAFPQHPDAEIILSFPGLGVQLGARVLAETGDDKARFADARGLKAYAGASPITRASGKRSSITRRWVKNDRLNHAGYLWAFASITASPGAKAHTGTRTASASSKPTSCSTRCGTSWSASAVPSSRPMPCPTATSSRLAASSGLPTAEEKTSPCSSPASSAESRSQP